ncbi:hypothetical protein ACFWZ6_13435 [Streptomyces massasporeus]
MLVAQVVPNVHTVEHVGDVPAGVVEGAARPRAARVARTEAAGSPGLELAVAPDNINNVRQPVTNDGITPPATAPCP